MKFIKTKGVLVLILLFFGSLVFAQSTPMPTILLTWEADSYVPSDYLGRTIPSSNNSVSVALQAFSSRGGVVSVSSREISWFINNKFITSGVGMTSLTFDTKSVLANSYNVKVVVRKYFNGRDISQNVIIPTINPIVVIDAPYPNRLVDDTLFARAIPYFFNINGLFELSFDWDISGTNLLTEIVDVGLEGGSSGITVPVRVQATNNNVLERADDLILLKVQ